MAIGPLCTVVPIQFHRYLSPATLKSYLACDETYGNELRKSVEPADIPVIVKNYSEVVYDGVQKRLNQLGKQAVEALHPWVVNTLVDWDDFDKWICMAAEETQKPNLPNDSPPGYYSTDGNPPCNSSTDDTPPRNSSTGDSPPHNSTTDDSPPGTLSESCKAKVSQNEVLQSPSFQWTRPAVLRLIALYKENEAKFQKPAIKKKTVWQEIVNKITEHLLPVTWQQCEQKWKNMTKAYRDTIDNNRKSGADRKECPLFKEIGEIYGYRPNVTPLHCEGSMACITAEAGESEYSTGSEEPGASTCSSPIKKKSRKQEKTKPIQ